MRLLKTQHFTKVKLAWASDLFLLLRECRTKPTQIPRQEKLIFSSNCSSLWPTHLKLMQQYEWRGRNNKHYRCNCVQQKKKKVFQYNYFDICPDNFPPFQSAFFFLLPLLLLLLLCAEVCVSSISITYNPIWDPHGWDSIPKHTLLIESNKEKET